MQSIAKKALAVSFCSLTLWAQTYRMGNPSLGSLHDSGWRVETATGRLLVSIPIGRVDGEIPIPVGASLSASFNSVWVGGGPHEGNILPSDLYDRHIFGTCGFGYIGKAFITGAWDYQRYLMMPDGRSVTDREFIAALDPWGKDLLSSFGLSGVASFKVNSSGDTFWIGPTTSLPAFAYPGLIALPQGFPGTPPYTYDLIGDKDTLGIYVQIDPNGASVPILWMDRFNHYVKFQWTRNTSNLPPGVLSIVQVDARNQRQQGVTLRYATFADTTTVHDLARVDFVGFAAPSALIQGYSGFATQVPTGFSLPSNWVVGTEHTGNDVVGGLVGRPTTVVIGDPNDQANIRPPSWDTSSPSWAYDASLLDPNQVSSQTWTIDYEPTTRAEIQAITTPNKVKTTFSYTNKQFFEPGNFYPPLARCVTKAVESDNSGTSATMHTRTWTNPGSQQGLLIDIQDYWSPGSQSDRTTEYLLSTAYSYLDGTNGFYRSTTIKDATSQQAWATTTFISDADASYGGGLDASLSLPSSIVVSRNAECDRKVDYGYASVPASWNLGAHAKDIQVGSVTKSVKIGSSWQIFETQMMNYNNDMISMLEAKQVADQTVWRSFSTIPLAYQNPIKTTNNWDQSKRLQLLQTYLDAGGSLHGIKNVYEDSSGKIAEKDVLHRESGVNLDSPRKETFTYDPRTGQLATHATTYLESVGSPGSAQSTIQTTNAAFDGANRPTCMTDERGVTTLVRYDLLGRRTYSATSGAPGEDLSYPDNYTIKKVVHMSKGDLISTTHLDGFGRVISEDLPDGSKIAYTYDLHSRIVTTTRKSANGTWSASSTTSYDLLDRITDQQSADGILTHFAYSTHGGNNVVTTRNVALGLTTVTEKDPYGQVVLVQAPNGDQTTHTYDGFGNKVTTTIQSSVDPDICQTRTNTYDNLGRLIQKYDPETKYQTFLNFNALNLAQTWTEGSSAVDWLAPRPRVHYRTFDGLGRLRLETTGVTGETIAFQYTGAFLAGTNRTWGDRDYISKSFEYLAPGARISKETTNGNVTGAW